MGITYDSQNYLHASKTFLEKGILLNKDNTIFNQQPPLFPVILSFFSPKNENFAFYFNIFQIFCLIFTINIWLKFSKIIFKNNIFYHLFALSLCFATPLYLVHHFVWSEPFFLLLLSLDLYVFQKFLEKEEKKYFDKEIILMIILGFLYCLQRNTGVFFVFAKIVCYLSPLTPKGGTETFKEFTQNFPKKLGLMLFYGFFASLGWLIWFLVIYFMPKNENNAQVLGHFSWNIDVWKVFFYNGKDILVSFSTYFFPLPLVEKGGFLLKFFVLLVLFSLVFFAKKTKILGLIALIYTSFLLLFVPDFSDAERYLAVIYPLFLLVLYENLKELFDVLFLQIHLKFRFLTFFLMIILCFFMVYFQIYHFWRVCKNVHFYQEKKSDILIIMNY